MGKTKIIALFCLLRVGTSLTILNDFPGRTDPVEPENPFQKQIQEGERLEQQNGPSKEAFKAPPMHASAKMKNKPDVKIVFPLPPNKRRRLTFDAIPAQSMSNITICYWVKIYNYKHKNTVFSYATKTEPDAINIWIGHDDEKSGNVYVNMQIFGRAVSFSSHQPIFSIGEWRHVCHGWSSVAPHTHFLTVGGTFAKQTLTNSDPDGKAKLAIPGSGVAILGQDQDIQGGAFEASEAFVGELYDFQMWSRLLTIKEINNLCGCDDSMTGNVVKWMQKMYAKGGVEIRHTYQCANLN